MLEILHVKIKLINYVKLFYCYFYSSNTETCESKLNILILLTDWHILL